MTKRIDEGGKARYVPRDLGKLSLGQQQSVLLALILCSSGNHPLILDQPEDNLDGEFIYHTLVPVLRRAKERRQIIVVTHNANIAVLAEKSRSFVRRTNSCSTLALRRPPLEDTPIVNELTSAANAASRFPARALERAESAPLEW